MPVRASVRAAWKNATGRYEVELVGTPHRGDSVQWAKGEEPLEVERVVYGENSVLLDVAVKGNLGAAERSALKSKGWIFE